MTNVRHLMDRLNWQALYKSYREHYYYQSRALERRLATDMVLLTIDIFLGVHNLAPRVPRNLKELRMNEEKYRS
jgi:hypothetical protein